MLKKLFVPHFISDYFQELMKKMRSQILKICLIGLISCGLGLAVTQPAEANTSTRDFAHWLHSVAKTTNATELEHKLAPLKNSKADLFHLIEQASQIVSQNNGDFNLPLDGESASERIHQILLVEWNQFETGNAMTAVPPVSSVKAFVSFQSPKIFNGSIESFLRKNNVNISFGFADEVQQKVCSAHHFFIIPMQGGIAIGAP